MIHVCHEAKPFLTVFLPDVIVQPISNALLHALVESRLKDMVHCCHLCLKALVRTCTSIQDCRAL